ncbi:hypothetical protein [Streptomyces parvus]
MPPPLQALPFRMSRAPVNGHGIGVGGVPGSSPLHDVGPAHGSGYRYNRA